MQRAQEPLFSFFFSFSFFDQLPFPILLWGLASGGHSVSGSCIGLPFLRKPILGGRRHNPLLPLSQLFWDISQRCRAWSPKDTLFSRRGGVPASSGYSPRFLGGSYGC